jgi:hypothetical protein
MKPVVRDPEAEVTMVHELIDSNLGCWDIDKLEENFAQVDVRAIGAIPIGRFSEDDWAWSLEKNGNFTVRSAYRLLITKRQDNLSPSSSDAAGSVCWKKLWKLPVPPKVRSFWWRVINNYVRCRFNLKERHMEDISFCKICGEEKETIYHALFECSWARAFWQELKQAIEIKILKLHPRSWASDLIDANLVPEEHTCMILCGAWAAWTERNAIWHGEEGRSVIQSVR